MNGGTMAESDRLPPLLWPLTAVTPRSKSGTAPQTKTLLGPGTSRSVQLPLRLPASPDRELPQGPSLLPPNLYEPPLTSEVELTSSLDRQAAAATVREHTQTRPNSNRGRPQLLWPPPQPYTTTAAPPWAPSPAAHCRDYQRCQYPNLPAIADPTPSAASRSDGGSVVALCLYCRRAHTSLSQANIWDGTSKHRNRLVLLRMTSPMGAASSEHDSAGRFVGPHHESLYHYASRVCQPNFHEHRPASYHCRHHSYQGFRWYNTDAGTDEPSRPARDVQPLDLAAVTTLAGELTYHHLYYPEGPKVPVSARLPHGAGDCFWQRMLGPRAIGQAFSPGFGSALAVVAAATATTSSSDATAEGTRLLKRSSTESFPVGYRARKIHHRRLRGSQTASSPGRSDATCTIPAASRGIKSRPPSTGPLPSARSDYRDLHSSRQNPDYHGSQQADDNKAGDSQPRSAHDKIRCHSEGRTPGCSGRGRVTIPKCVPSAGGATKSTPKLSRLSGSQAASITSGDFPPGGVPSGPMAPTHGSGRCVPSHISPTKSTCLKPSATQFSPPAVTLASLSGTDAHDDGMHEHRGQNLAQPQSRHDRKTPLAIPIPVSAYRCHQLQTPRACSLAFDMEASQTAVVPIAGTADCRGSSSGESLAMVSTSEQGMTTTHARAWRITGLLRDREPPASVTAPGPCSRTVQDVAIDVPISSHPVVSISPSFSALLSRHHKALTTTLLIVCGTAQTIFWNELVNILADLTGDLQATEVAGHSRRKVFANVELADSITAVNNTGELLANLMLSFRGAFSPSIRVSSGIVLAVIPVFTAAVVHTGGAWGPFTLQLLSAVGGFLAGCFSVTQFALATRISHSAAGLLSFGNGICGVVSFGLYAMLRGMILRFETQVWMFMIIAAVIIASGTGGVIYLAARSQHLGQYHGTRQAAIREEKDALAVAAAAERHIRNIAAAASVLPIRDNNDVGLSGSASYYPIRRLASDSLLLGCSFTIAERGTSGARPYGTTTRRLTSPWCGRPHMENPTQTGGCMDDQNQDDVACLPLRDYIYNHCQDQREHQEHLCGGSAVSKPPTANKDGEDQIEKPVNHRTAGDEGFWEESQSGPSNSTTQSSQEVHNIEPLVVGDKTCGPQFPSSFPSATTEASQRRGGSEKTREDGECVDTHAACYVSMNMNSALATMMTGRPIDQRHRQDVSNEATNPEPISSQASPSHSIGGGNSNPGIIGYPQSAPQMSDGKANYDVEGSSHGDDRSHSKDERADDMESPQRWPPWTSDLRRRHTDTNMVKSVRVLESGDRAESHNRREASTAADLWLTALAPQPSQAWVHTETQCYSGHNIHPLAMESVVSIKKFASVVGQTWPLLATLFFTSFVTFFLFPSFGPLRWPGSTKQKTLVLGSFQIGEFLGCATPVIQQRVFPQMKHLTRYWWPWRKTGRHRRRTERDRSHSVYPVHHVEMVQSLPSTPGMGKDRCVHSAGNLENGLGRDVSHNRHQLVSRLRSISVPPSDEEEDFESVGKHPRHPAVEQLKNAPAVDDCGESLNALLSPRTIYWLSVIRVIVLVPLFISMYIWPYPPWSCLWVQLVVAFLHSYTCDWIGVSAVILTSFRVTDTSEQGRAAALALASQMAGFTMGLWAAKWTFLLDDL